MTKNWIIIFAVCVLGIVGYAISTKPQSYEDCVKQAAKTASGSDSAFGALHLICMRKRDGKL